MKKLIATHNKMFHADEIAAKRKAEKAAKDKAG